MNNLNIQWITQDPNLFEYDWLTEILDTTDIRLITKENQQALVDKNSIVICNHAVNYRVLLDQLRQNHKKYGIFLLSDENLIEPCEWLHDPACVFVVRNYINPWVFGHPKVTTVGLGFKRGFKRRDLQENPITKREYLWCFAGTLHGEREKMVEYFNELRPFKTHYCSGFNATDGLDVKQYREALNDSIFALCPPGQDSMDSFRFYEALEAGCIPVALKRTNRMPIHPSYWHAIFEGEESLPFVLGDSWEECAVLVRQVVEKDEIKITQSKCKELWTKTVKKWKEQIKISIKTLETI